MLAPEPYVPKVVWLAHAVLPAFGRAHTEMRLFLWSATQAVSPSAETDTPVGNTKLLAPVPVVPKVVWLTHAVLPAFGRVHTEMRLLRRSATHAVSPSAETNTPVGPLKLLASAPFVPKVVWLTQAFTHTPVAVLQAGVLPLQSWSDVQTTQMPVAVWHRGAATVHALSSTHPTHVFVVVLQNGVLPEQALSSTHATQVLVAVLQYGVLPEQKLSDVHATQVFVDVLQARLFPVQKLSAVHATQVFVDVLQARLFPVQKLSAVHATQVFVDVLQAGLLPEQKLSAVQATQVFVVAVSQAGVLPEHWLSALHCTHVPATQPGVAPEHAAPAPQPHRSFMQVSPVGTQSALTEHCASQRQIARAVPTFADPALPTRFQVTRHRSLFSSTPLSTTEVGVPPTVCSVPMHICHGCSHGAVIPSTEACPDASDPVTYPP